MSATRTESDAFGEVQVAADRYWGAQTERSLENFRINQPQDRMPPAIVKAFGILKGAAATVNIRYGLGMSYRHLFSWDAEQGIGRGQAGAMIASTSFGCDQVQHSSILPNILLGNTLNQTATPLTTSK